MKLKLISITKFLREERLAVRQKLMKGDDILTANISFFSYKTWNLEAIDIFSKQKKRICPWPSDGHNGFKFSSLKETSDGS